MVAIASVGTMAIDADAQHHDDGSGDRPALLILDFDGVCFDRSRHEIDPDAVALVGDAQRHGILVAVLSSELDDTTIATTPLLDEVDHTVVCTTGIQKPDRRAFQRVMLLTGIDAHRTVVVDDSEVNVRGAAAAGATAIAFDVDDRAASWTSVRRAAGLTAG